MRLQEPSGDQTQERDPQKDPVEHEHHQRAALEEGDQPASAVEREPNDHKSAEMSFLGYLGSLLLAPFRFMQREREITQAINLLSAMDDRSLRDIGLHRSQIAHTVRYGRDED